MPRISLIPVESMHGQVKEAAQMLEATLGVVPHSFRTYAHRPEIALAFANLARAWRNQRSLHWITGPPHNPSVPQSMLFIREE